ncbi:MAG: hypothetical protein R3B45_01890 [Bdellovibrionota bacterium]
MLFYKRQIRCCFIVFLNVFGIISLLTIDINSLYAQQGKREYPELLVTPSATSRLEREALEEEASARYNFFAIQASSLLLFTAGVLAINDERLPSQGDQDIPMAKWAGTIAISSAAGIFALTTSMSYLYRPYQTGWSKVEKLPTETKRENISRERTAEETLRNAFYLSKKLKWIAVIINASMSAFIVNSSEDNLTRVVGAAAGVGSILPMIFTSNLEQTYEQHQMYKNRIYGPVARGEFLRGLRYEKLYPGVSLTWRF